MSEARAIIEESSIDKENKEIEISNIRNRMEQRKKKRRRKKIIGTISACCIALSVIYLGGVKFYSTHFCPGTVFKGVNCSNLKNDEAVKKLVQRVSEYKYCIESNTQKEEISGRDIELEIAGQNIIADVMQTQNKWLWFCNALLNKEDMDMRVSYNEDLLIEKFNNLDCIAETNQKIREHMGEIIYNSDMCAYELISNSAGEESTAQTTLDDTQTKIVNKDKLYTCIKSDLENLKSRINIGYSGCYIDVEAENELLKLIEGMNKLVSAKIFYKNDAGENVAYLDGGSINQWINVGDNFNITINNDMVSIYVDELSARYNTVGKERKFKTSLGTEVVVSGGDYGWIMDKEAEKQAITAAVSNGEVIDRKPEFKQKASVIGDLDIGATYAEISISNQKIWFYKDGNLIVSSPIVTGNPYRGNGTTPGVYQLKYKERNATLVGEDYRTPVGYWMPFNKGQGMHDATWRGSFGGQIYRGNGSHGCVNLPLNTASAIYSNISAGDPIVVY